MIPAQHPGNGPPDLRNQRPDAIPAASRHTAGTQMTSMNHYQ